MYITHWHSLCYAYDWIWKHKISSLQILFSSGSDTPPPPHRPRPSFLVLCVWKSSQFSVCLSLSLWACKKLLLKLERKTKCLLYYCFVCANETQVSVCVQRPFFASTRWSYGIQSEAMAYNQKPDTADDVLMRPANCAWSTVALRALPQWWRTTEVNCFLLGLFLVCLFVFIQVKNINVGQAQDSCPSMLSAPLCLSVCLSVSLAHSITHSGIFLYEVSRTSARLPRSRTMSWQFFFTAFPLALTAQQLTVFALFCHRLR